MTCRAASALRASSTSKAVTSRVALTHSHFIRPVSSTCCTTCCRTKLCAAATASRNAPLTRRWVAETLPVLILSP
jgi:hypothetical protein